MKRISNGIDAGLGLSGLSGGVYKAILDNLNDGIYFIDKERKITYWNKAAEALTGYKAADVLGRLCTHDVVCHLSKKGSPICLKPLCPLNTVFRKSKVHEEELYIRHKDGQRVCVQSRMMPLKDKNDKLIGAVAVLTENTREVAAKKKSEYLKKMALLDELTGLGNRRYGEANILSRLNELKRYGWSFGICFIDIDHFKDANDKYGHEVGDKVLKMVANTLAKGSRSFDTFVRWGGEEFVGIIANVKEGELFLVADRFRALVEQSSFKLGGEEVLATVSVGATNAQIDDTVKSIVDRADRLMYHSKSAGRNRVSMK